MTSDPDLAEGFGWLPVNEVFDLRLVVGDAGGNLHVSCVQSGKLITSAVGAHTTQITQIHPVSTRPKFVHYSL